MSIPKIELRSKAFKRKFKLNLMAINIENLNKINNEDDDNNIYMPSEISHLIAKLLFNTSIYGDISRLFKIYLPRNVQMVQVILVENLSNEELTRLKISNEPCGVVEYLKKENFSEINFTSSSSWVLCGFEEFFTLPMKSLTIFGADLLAKRRKYDTGESHIRLTPQILLSTPTEMYWDDVPTPGKIHLEQGNQYLFSQTHYTPPSNDPRNILAIDCEMVSTGDLTDLDLARISVVRCGGDIDLTNSKGVKEWLAKGAPYDVVYDELVNPNKRVVDYLSKYSGITEKSLENVVLTLDDVHSQLRSIIKSDSILVGHSLQMDLKALKLYHPYIIDTSTIYNTSGDVNRKPGLLSLSRDILKHEIRKKRKNGGHDSVEDAYTALRLMMLKLLKDMDFGNKTRTTHFTKPLNTLLGEWKDVPNVNEKEIICEVMKVEDVELCKIDFSNREINIHSSNNSEDIQKKIDKFLLLCEQPAVIKTSELMYAANKSMNAVVNINGIIGQCQRQNNCPCVYKELSDLEVVKRTIKKSTESDLLVSVLSDYNEVKPGSSYDQRVAQFSSLQSNIENIVKGTTLMSAILVILPGQYGCESTGKIYWKIK